MSIFLDLITGVFIGREFFFIMLSSLDLSSRLCSLYKISHGEKQRCGCLSYHLFIT